MSNNEKVALVPKYRFPEFKNEKEWEYIKLGSLAKKVTIKNKDGHVTRVLTNSAIDGIVDQSEYFDRKIVDNKNISNYYIVNEGDFVYNPRISSSAPVGPISVNKLGTGIMSPLYTVFRFIDSQNDYYEQYFKTNLWNDYIKSVANTGVRYDRISISAKNFMSLPLLSTSEREQQKIVDCLSTIDDLISAEDRKLTALMSNKKGLMQKLLPADGKTVPEWRFPEFRGNGDWEKTSFEQVFDKLRYGLNAAAKQYDGKNKYIRITDIDDMSGKYLGENPVSPDCELDDNYLVKDRDILFARTGASTGKTYMYTKEDGILYFAGFLICGNVDKVYYPQFIFEQTRSHSYEKWVAVTSMRSGQPGINATEYESYTFNCPSLPEQKKVADCLSSINSLINMQGDKIEALKQHKKALIQGIFPLIEEAK